MPELNLRLPTPDPRLPHRRTTHHDDAEESKIQKTATRTPAWKRHSRREGLLRRFRAAGVGSGLGYGAPDRGRPYRHDPSRQAWREDLDPHFPGQADPQP